MSDEQIQFSICALLYTLLFCFVFMLFTISYLILINCQPDLEDDIRAKQNSRKEGFVYRTNSTICPVIEV